MAQDGAAGPTKRWLEQNSSFKPDISTAFQLWGAYTKGFEVFDENTGRYEAVENRFNLSLHRARIILSGEPYHKLKYSVGLAYDRSGRDLLAGTVGSTNRADPAVVVWDSYLHWRPSKDQSLNLVAGWFRPQMQRESITSAWAVSSFEKSMSQNNVRYHLVGTSPGRAAGLNLGGLLGKEKWWLTYNVGIFNPVTTGMNSSSVGQKYAPLLVGRASLSIGDPEMEQYNLGHLTNFFGKRKGVSLDFNFSTQNETGRFVSATAWGPGLLLNWGPVNLDAEWIWMEKQGTRNPPNGFLRTFTTQSGAGHARLGLNLPAGRYILEPTVMVMHFSGEMSAEGQADALAVGAASGETTTWDMGLNWHLDGRNLRLMFHYTWHSGKPGAAGDGATVNQYFSQNGVGAVHRGDWLGLGLNAMF